MPVFIPPTIYRLLDIVHADQKLYLVFEFLDVDLKRYMDLGNKSGNPITLELVKVSHLYILRCFSPHPRLLCGPGISSYPDT